MASTFKRVTVPSNSPNLEAAKVRVFEFFRAACRSIPTVMQIYNLYDVVTPSKLRSTISSQIRKNQHVTNLKVIDLLLLKGVEEMSNIVEHSKQRHHMLGQYVVGSEGLVKDLTTFHHPSSPFLQNFYKSNYPSS